VWHLGLNNLPKPALEGLSELLGDVPKLLTGLLLELHTQSEFQVKSASSPEDTRASSYLSNSNSSLTSGTAVSLGTSALLAQTQTLGYASQCELVRANVVWRPMRVERGCLSVAGGQPATHSAQDQPICQ